MMTAEHAVKAQPDRLVFNSESGVVTGIVGGVEVFSVPKEIINVNSSDDLYEFAKGFPSIESAAEHVKTLSTAMLD